jgi:glutamate synthase (NADPH/NADH) large chain
MNTLHRPERQGLYDPHREHDACGVGFIADINNRASHDIVRQGLQILVNLDHRGAVGADPLTGDGAGILIQTPDRFLRAQCSDLGIELPAPGDYACGPVFLPREAGLRARCERAIAETTAREGQILLGWRDVPTDNRCLSDEVKAKEPVIRQVFISRGPIT